MKQIYYLCGTYLFDGRVRSVVVDELLSSKYNCVCIHSTPDISHVDQLTIVIRYYREQGPVERFFAFMNMECNTGKD